MGVQIRKKKLGDGRISLWLDIYWKGQRKAEFLNLYLGPDKEQNHEFLRMAKAQKSKREFELQMNQFGCMDHKRKMNFFEFAELTIRNKKPQTVAIYRQAIVKLEDFGGRSMTIEAITTDLCERFRDYLSSNCHPNTMVTYFIKVKSILEVAVKQGIIQKNPAREVRVRGVPNLPKFLTVEELKKLVQTKCGNTIVRDAFVLSCFTGLRVSDILALKFEQIGEGHLVVREKKTGNISMQPLAPLAMVILERQKTAIHRTRGKQNHPDGTVFPMPSRAAVNWQLQRWAKKAGVNKHLTFHWARHTFATMALTHGVDIYTVSKLLGHKRVETTTIYARVIDSRKRDAVLMLPEIGV